MEVLWPFVFHVPKVDNDEHHRRPILIVSVLSPCHVKGEWTEWTLWSALLVGVPHLRLPLPRPQPLPSQRRQPALADAALCLWVPAEAPCSPSPAANQRQRQRQGWIAPVQQTWVRWPP